MESDDEELEVFEPNGELPQPKSRPTFTRPGVKPDERVAELEAKLKEKEEELQQLEREQLLKVKPLEEEVSRQDSELKRVRADLVDANAEKERLLSEVKIVHSATNKLADLEQAIKVKDAELQENFREASSLRSQLRKKDEEKAAALLKKDEEKATALELKDKEREAAAAASLSVQRMLEAEIKQKESQLQLGDKREAERQTVLLLQTELEQKNRQVEELTAQEQLRQKEWTLVVARLETQLELQKEQIQEMEGERQVSTATTGKLRLELQETTQRLQEVTSDATALRADLDRQTHTITSGFSEKEQQVAALEAALVEKDAELQALKSDNLEAAATLTRSNADLAVRSSELSVAQELVRERHAEVLEAQELLRESERQRAELEVRLAQVQANLDSRTGELATNLELVETNNEKLQRAEELLAETQKKLEAKEDSLVSLQVKLSTLSSGQSETLTLMEQSAQEKDATIESLREAAARDAEQLEQHSLALAEALATCKLRATEHEAVVAANKALVEDTEQLAKALAQCKQEGYEALEQAAVAQAAKAAEVVTLTAEVQRLTNLESEHCTTLGTAEADKGDLRAMLLACQADNDTLRAHAVARDREVTSLEKALAQSETRVRAHEEQLAELKEVAARGDKAAKDDADSAQTRLAQVTAALQDKEEQVSHLVEQVTSLTQELAEAGASSKIAAAEIQRLTEMEGNYNASKSSLQSQVRLLQQRFAPHSI